MIKFYSLTSGSSGNCTFVSDGKTNILIDCGMNGKAVSNRLNKIDANASDIDAILLTHEHTDHISGAGVISRRFDIPIYATQNTLSAMINSKCPIGKIAEKNLLPVSKDTDFEIGSIGFNAFSIPHDSADPVGYNIYVENGKRKLSVATDMGKVDKNVVSKLLGSESILLESNHDIFMLQNGGYPFSLKQRILSAKGHLSNESCAKIAACLVKNGTKKITLGHLSSENNLPKIAYNTSKTAIETEGATVGIDVCLQVALRSEPVAII